MPFLRKLIPPFALTSVLNTDLMNSVVFLINSKSKATTVAEHFLSSSNHTPNDMQLIPIEKVFSNRDSIRKAREAFLIVKAWTIVHEGLNIRDGTY